MAVKKAVRKRTVVKRSPKKAGAKGRSYKVVVAGQGTMSEIGLTKTAPVKKVTRTTFEKPIQVTVGRSRKSDKTVEMRVGATLAKQLRDLAGGDGRINMSEEQFYQALSPNISGALDQGVEVTGAKRALEESLSNLEKVIENPSILDIAKDIIYGDREKAYGSPRFNLDTIAQFWTVYLQRKFSGSEMFIDLELRAEDVSQMMILLKTARLIHNPTHKDSLTDQAGYAALQDRIQNL